jgi:hypothetical protein
VIPASILLQETLPETFNGNAVKGRQRFSLNLFNVSKTPLFCLKTKRWWSLPPPLLARSRSLRLFFVPRDESEFEREALG